MGFNITPDKLLADAKRLKDSKSLVALLSLMFDASPFPDRFFGDDSKPLRPKQVYHMKAFADNVKAITNPTNITKFTRAIPCKFAMKAGSLSVSVGEFSLNIKPSGKKAASGTQDAASTKKQENASCVAFALAFANKEITVADIKREYPECDDAWFQSFLAQAAALKKWWGGDKNGYTFERDGDIMSAVAAAAKRFGYSTKDSYNPADVWAVKSNKRSEVVKMVEEAENDYHLNDIMSNLLEARVLVGISLKKTGKVAAVEESNVKKTQSSKKVFAVKKFTKLNCYFELKNGLFRTNEASFLIGDNVAGQARIMGTQSPSVTIQTELIGRGAEARLGKVPVNIIRGIFDEHKQKYPEARKTPKDWEHFWNKRYTWARRFRIAQRGGVDLSVKTVDEFFDVMRTVYAADSMESKIAINSKLQALVYISSIIQIINKGEGDTLATQMYYAAKKELGEVGPFIKIS